MNLIDRPRAKGHHSLLGSMPPSASNQSMARHKSFHLLQIIEVEGKDRPDLGPLL